MWRRRREGKPQKEMESHRFAYGVGVGEGGDWVLRPFSEARQAEPDSFPLMLLRDVPYKAEDEG